MLNLKMKQNNFYLFKKYFAAFCSFGCQHFSMIMLFGHQDSFESMFLEPKTIVC